MSDSSLAPVTLTLPDGSLSVSVIRKGLHIHRLLVAEVCSTGGKTHDLVPGPENFKGARGFENCIVGRYCNRLPARELPLPGGLSATPIQFPEHCTGVSLHGGPDEVGWDQKVWDVIPLESSTLYSEAERRALETALPEPQRAVFRLVSPDGEGGFPGEVTTDVVMGVVAGEGKEAVGAVVIIYRAALSKGGIETPINLTQHWGFNLDASFNGPSPTDEGSNVRNHVLTIRVSTWLAPSTLELDPETSLPTGNFIKTPPGSSHDHTSGKKISDNYPAQGYDDFYIFDDSTSPIDPLTFPQSDLFANQDRVSAIIGSIAPPNAAASLSSALSGLSLSFTTNQPGVQLYTAPGGGSAIRKRIHGGGPAGTSAGYSKENSAFLEFHAPYGPFVLHELKEAARGWNTILKRGDIYHNFARVDVQVAGNPA